MEFTVKQIAAMLNGKVEGDESLKINQLAKIEEARAGQISFLSNPKYESYLYTTQAAAVIVGQDFDPKKDFSTTLIRVENAYTAFTKLLEEYEKILKGHKIGIEQPSYVGASTQLGQNIYLGAFAYVGSNTHIGNDVKIYPQAYVGDNVQIGDNTIIHPGVRIYNNTIIGKNCVIFANSVVGGDGFGFAPQPDGSYRTIPQLGNVIIEDNVNIGSNVTIDCATMGSTIIREGVKLDNLIQVAHNVEIGKNTVMAAQSGIAGSTKVGENCVVGGQVAIIGHITVADRTQMGGQSGVNRSVKEPGKALNGTPAMDMKDSLRSLAMFRKLPEMDKKLKELETRLNELDD
ncbi:MAG: UDP-3-O-(3-hydroxymyristoyl)glucosamine N-acyltransferase [Runella slithyformis]|nr:MAG: UDP-3-O-(3-hydroxymyristoyl)glucosamine N-acyltransferase [Runella slithyformis]TAG24851.1 MAG: UDP-3-O-(3-hydroxymyristoyl)glucosamine N-acyltransferase [Cytophagales bacterium]TAG42449.1 MAG: UDP-3-O-(3-hydroxymyristoyl)glucosamine N-acyltransferase [Cytophagia bacterium]TAF78791.1 MAG: UDP-3-O-(3-hydroxymyristoyl)glucosamine N-acyltransferase [Runella slithyformis]TAG57304.1 MAG: UDP-3-O-(3-hydroxymyristoyl)glucosamine N-acyltransferase [Runella slithyformis]